MTLASDLQGLAEDLRADRNITGKRDIDATCTMLGLNALSSGKPGDDTAAIADGDGWQLMATEGFINGFVEADPWFAGWCGVMVNLSDVAAMGGRATALTNAIWAPGADQARPILEGMRAASEAYGVPIVGGHSNLRTDRCQLAVSVHGRANRLITSFDARPGDVLIAAVDHRGAYREPFDNWQAAIGAPSDRLRGDLDILPDLAEAGLVHAGKDISQGGIPGTALMLAECSGVGIEIDISAIPLPEGVSLRRFLTSFPSFGFLLSVSAANAHSVLARFTARDISAAQIGKITTGSELSLVQGGARAILWDHGRNRYLGLSPKEPANA